ncbi:MAG: type II toxin-antitoxin system RelE/ParE family toxin [Treponema sp.]|jgi:addiction module RelE/StbE family toxin|nr:type II toxin-antitoxin system RelE/ParE family toxin [Treponema sp.]
MNYRKNSKKMVKKIKEYEKYHVKITQGAEKDLNEIIDYIAQNNPRTASVIMEKIITKIKTLDHFPYRGGYVPELLARNVKDYRQITEEPWKIYYKIDDDIVNILAIIDSRRNLKDILINKLLK